MANVNVQIVAFFLLFSLSLHSNDFQTFSRYKKKPGLAELHYLISNKDLSSHTSSYPGAFKNLYPGGSPKYLIASGHHSGKCSIWSGRKKSGSSENSSPAQMYHPDVSPAGGCRSPLIGCNPFFTFKAIPTFKNGGVSKKGALYFSQIIFCSSL